MSKGLRSAQRGAVLGVALILLLVITILAVVGARTGIFELRMSLNEESRVSAFERAQSLIDGVITERSNLLVEGGVNSTRCTSNWGSTCTATVTIPADLIASGATARLRITQASDYLASTHPPGSARAYRTGDWRSQHPMWTKSRCIRCGVCWTVCPEPAIVEEPGGYFVMDPDYCKGCGICARECVTGCITMEPEEE